MNRNSLRHSQIRISDTMKNCSSIARKVWVQTKILY
jgi:hypothetical protein